ncbi:hypothetical protein RSAG8_06156, partial [Rhizoctonia solani AG-8 WAC10335]
MSKRGAQKSSKLCQATQCAPHNDSAEPVEGLQHAYKDLALNGHIKLAASSDSVLHCDGETTPPVISEFEWPLTDGMTLCQINNDTGVTIENMGPSHAASTEEPNLVDDEFGETVHSSEALLESGYEHWRTAYNSDSSCDDDGDDFDEAFISFLATSGTRLGM